MRLDDATLQQGRRKARAIAESFKLTGIDAMALSQDDWRLGAGHVRDLVKQYDLPILAANLVCGGDRPYPASKIVERGGWRVGIVGVSDGAVDGCKSEPAGPAVAKAVAELGPTDVIVLLAPVRVSKVEALVGEEPGVDLIVAYGGSPKAPVESGPGSSWVLAPSTRGKYLGIATLDRVGGDGWLPSGLGEALREEVGRLDRRLESARRRLETAKTDSQIHKREEDVRKIERQVAEAKAELEALESGELSKTRNPLVVQARPLDAKIADHPPTAEIVAGTLRDLAALEGVAHVDQGVPRVVPGDGPYAGSSACEECHPAEHAQWATTPHANAWASLVVDNHHADRECVACHATGYGQPGGPSAPAAVQGLRDVQCEACHGPARAHLTDPTGHKTVRDPAVETCTACHDGVRDEGRFDYARYRPLVVHGSALRLPPGPVAPAAPTGGH